MAASEQLDSFFKQHPHIRYVTPTSPDYPELRSTWYGNEGATPLGIARPQNAEDVGAIVSFTGSSNIPFTVRTGGHDSWFRGFAADALTIDMRDIDFVQIEASKSSARIGGGVLQGQVARELSKERLTTSMGSVPSVGYVGWAVCGGYGRFAGTYGMGVDQILAAKLVNCDGQILEADAEMLRIIRGGGGMLGVIVELTIKIYPLEKLLAGRIVFESSDLAAIIKEFASGDRALERDGFPAPLHILPVIVNAPLGKTLAVAFTWSSPDFATGRQYVDRVSSFGHAIMNTVEETNIPDWQEASAAGLPPVMFGIHNQKSCRVYSLSDQVAEVIADAAAKMPSDPATLTGIHTLREAEEPIQDSVFKVREPHFFIEMLSTVSEPDPKKIEEAKKWAAEYHDALMKIDEGNLEKAQYFTHTSPEDADFQGMYGEYWDSLVEAKRKYDPRNVFRSGPTFE
ncbi:hypothetical protein M409DRAFT_24878 [Zasmidium cellare ATCC 36951]|uniref:cytokinin dehydrogenase n=1 Tax=Zasmidium cellare ATCC 36951 TaxID=1080233 RepID=A0A6A6CHS3_ZASCE|nr:uncharacterized protein M409DRAFT_24878 [Zasmidium cellare ATCC 36951]KAF2164976.1 hypothetical protein M409DRAFT_24878 [Zasmidium cellare ATCC 36951]